MTDRKDQLKLARFAGRGSLWMDEKLATMKHGVSELREQDCDSY
jgi:hypothetical protein